VKVKLGKPVRENLGQATCCQSGNDTVPILKLRVRGMRFTDAV